MRANAIYRRLGAPALATTIAAGPALVGCSTEGARGGQMTASQADRYLDKAVHKSSEGVVLMPGEEAAKEYPIPRLNEIAQSLRLPLAGCFLERAVADMERGMVDGEEVYVNVPEGQIKVRARVGADGKIVTTETLELGFKDPTMEACIQAAIAKQRFPASRTAFNKHVDVVYWVSLGFFQGANTKAFATHMRKEQARAGLRARGCLVGRVPEGHYEIEGLNLFDRTGGTLASRVEDGPLNKDAAGCIASAFRAITIAPEREAFIRPASPRLVFDVTEDGEVKLADEAWLSLIEREEEALREEKRRELLGATDEPGPVAGNGELDPAAGELPPASSLGSLDKLGGAPGALKIGTVTDAVQAAADPSDPVASTPERERTAPDAAPDDETPRPANTGALNLRPRG